MIKALFLDIDGTLVDRHKQIPPRNREAIARFMAQGGVFSIATGRCDRSAQRIIDQVHPNGAAVTLNGAALYDSQKKQVIHDECLPDNYPQLVQKVFSRLPEIGIQLFCGSSVTSVRESGVSVCSQYMSALPPRMTIAAVAILMVRMLR